MTEKTTVNANVRSEMEDKGSHVLDAHGRNMYRIHGSDVRLGKNEKLASKACT